jgi:hypothetical protein
VPAKLPREESPGRDGAKFGVRAALLGLIDHLPGGSIVTRILEDRYPSPREREQAARVGRLEDKVFRQKTPLEKSAELREFERDRRRRDSYFKDTR